MHHALLVIPPNVILATNFALLKGLWDWDGRVCLDQRKVVLCGQTFTILIPQLVILINLDFVEHQCPVSSHILNMYICDDLSVQNK